MKTKLLTLLTVPLILFTATLGHGDDTEIYINDSIPEPGLPLIMIMMDFRSNLTSTQCQAIGKGGNKYGVDDPRHPCYGFFYDGDGNKLIANVPLVDDDVNFGEMLLGAIRKVLLGLVEDPDVGEDAFKLGMMMNHSAGDLAGPLDVPIEDYEGSSPSNGGFVFQGFKLVNRQFIDEFVAKALPLAVVATSTPTESGCRP